MVSIATAVRVSGVKLFCGAAMVLGFAATTHAVEAPGLAAATPRKAALVSAASLDKLEALAKSVGIEQLPPFLTPGGIGQQFEFIGPDGVAADKPIGMIYYVMPGAKASSGEGIEFVLPVKPDAATAKSLTQAGGKPVSGDADSFMFDSEIFKRTAHYLIFGKTGEVIHAVNTADADLTDLYKGTAEQNTLARMDVDVKAIRDGNPEQFQAFLDQIGAQSLHSSDAERFGQNLVLNFAKYVNRLDASVSESSDTLAVRLVIAPVKAPEAVATSKPGMPVEAIARVDVATSPLKLFPEWESGLDRFLDAVIKDTQTSEVQQTQVKAFMKKATILFAGGNAMSIGIAPTPDAAIVYLVQQNDAPVDLGAEMHEFADDFAKLSAVMDDKAKGENTSIDVTTYTDDEALEVVQVVRSRMTDGGKPKFYIDAAQKGNVVFFTFSGEGGRHVGDLSRLDAQGRMSGLISGSADLGKLIKAAGTKVELPAEQLGQLTASLKDKMFSFSADGQKDALVCTFTVPTDALKQFIVPTDALKQVIRLWVKSLY